MADDRTLGAYIQQMRQPQKDPYAGMRPDFAERLMLLQADLQDRGIDTNVISGVRDSAKQAALYAQGRTAPGPVVTNAQAGSSLHNYGAAADVVPFDRTQQPAMHAGMQELTGGNGLQWGGNFKSLYDPNHVQLPTTARQLAAGGAIPAAPVRPAGSPPGGPAQPQMTAGQPQGPLDGTNYALSTAGGSDGALAAALQAPAPQRLALQDPRAVEAQRMRELALLTGQGRLAALFA